MSKSLKNPRWEKFANEFVKHGNATRAYKSAGYTGRGAEQSASALLRVPEVSSRVEEIKRVITERILRREICKRQARIDAAQDRWQRMMGVIVARAEDPDMRNAAGGDQGVLVRRLKMLGAGENAQLVEEFEFDAALMREIREIEKQVAIETGEWVEKREVGGESSIEARLIAGRERVFGRVVDVSPTAVEPGEPRGIEGGKDAE